MCVEDEGPERNKMKDDLRFCTLDQWPADIRHERENDIENGPRPCLTIDKINQYIVQVVNDMRQGKPGINVRPQDDKADVDTAKIIKGIIRNIEDQSSADIAYITAGENAAKIGLGFFRITTEYVSEDSFDQDIFIRPLVELKNAEIITVLTTNHIEKVHDALLRPGRLDAVIPVRPCDPEAAMKLVRKYAGLLLPATESLDQVGMLLNGQIPAVVNEVVERAKLAAVMHRGDANTLHAEDIVMAAEGMLEQLSLMPQTEATNGLEDALHLIGLTPRVTSRG